MADRPTLHEIAAMPFPASVEAMRKHYNPAWGKLIDGDGAARRYRVKLSGTVTTRDYINETVEVDAFSSDEAIKLAEEEIDDRHPDADEIDFDMREAEDIGEAPSGGFGVGA